MSVELEEKVTASLVDGKLSCPIAFNIAKELKVSHKKIGKVADEFGIKITECQLGCFKPDKTTYHDTSSIDMNSTLAKEVKESLVGGYLPCAVAFQVAKKLKVTPEEIRDAADKLKLLVVRCQLGCFP